MVKGEVSIGEERLNAGDAAALTDMTQIQVRSRTAAEVLLFDLA